MGRWEHRYPQASMKGFRITQMMVPDIPPKDIYKKIEDYPLVRLKNEVLGESYEKADKPFTKDFMMAVVDRDFAMMPTITNTQFANTPTFMGIDWGEGEKDGAAGTGYTILTVSAYDSNGKFQTIYAKRFERGDELDPDFQIKTILNVAEVFRCRMIMADYGAGVKENKRLRKVLGNRFYQVQYVGTQKKKINFDKKEFKFLIERSDWMTDFIDFCQDGGWRLFGKDDDGMVNVFISNFTAIYSEYRKSSNGLAEKLFYGHPISQPDDAYHSTFYSWFASLMYKNGSYTPEGRSRKPVFAAVRA